MAQTDNESTNIPQLSVSELAGALKRTLEDQFGYVRIRGEISGYRGQHSSGHAYFTLKDESARLDAVIWRTTYSRMRVKPEEGLEVVASGRITTFAGKSSYQIIVESLEPAGVGALMALLEARRQLLASEGLFDGKHKKPLPFLPRTIGVVTSPTGSVIRDILHRLADRFPTRVILWPVRVQGETSAEEVVAAIRGLNALADGGEVVRPDVIIVARGGGSLEDLWSFNDERVVRAAAESGIPLVSAVGHETDWTLIDHAADLRAPTPTAAAEICVPVRADLVLRKDQLEARAIGAATRLLRDSSVRLRSTTRGMPAAKSLLAYERQRLDLATDGLRSSQDSRMNARIVALARIASALQRNSPHVRVARTAERIRFNGTKLRYLRQKSIAVARQKAERPKLYISDFSTRVLRSRSEYYRLTLSRWNGKQAETIRLPIALRREAARAQAALRRATTEQLRSCESNVLRIGKVFKAVNYKSVLARGFVLALDRSGSAISRLSEAESARLLTLRFFDGQVEVTVLREDSVSKRSRKRKAHPQQGTLF